MMEQYRGVLGILAILVIAFLLSTNKKAVRPRVILAAFALQAALAALVLYVPAGRAALSAMSDGVQALIGYSSAGIQMVFGPLTKEFSFAIGVLPIIIFFSALMSVLYHIGVMQRIIQWGGGAVKWLIGVGRVDAMTATANVFVGQTEAPLVVKPYLPYVTQPQLFSIMVSGMASVSGSVLAAYAGMGINVEYLLAASFMSAPGGLLMAKMIMPDNKDEPEATLPPEALSGGEAKSNVIMAAAEGAADGLKLALSIGAMLIAFVSLIALLNGLFGMVGGWFGRDDITIQGLLGYVFSPVMYLINVPWAESQVAGGIFGQKLILNEFVAYGALAEVQASLSERTRAILTFSLCGFANLSSIAILMGAFSSLAPEKTPIVAKYGLHVVAAGSLSNLMSAALAGLFIAG
jgi:concentrative nucleoside transporter, CNT family